MITATVKMGHDFITNVHGETIEEVIEKIKSYHTMSEFERQHYANKGKLDSTLKSGWFLPMYVVLLNDVEQSIPLSLAEAKEFAHEMGGQFRVVNEGTKQVVYRAEEYEFSPYFID